MKKTPTKNETPEAKIAEIEKGLVPLEKEAQGISIKTVDDIKGATSFLAKVKGYADRVNELQTFFTEPYVEQRRVALEKKREIEEMFAPKLKPLNEMISKVKRAIGDYTLEQERKARAEEARLLKIREAADKKREENGKGQIIEPVKTVERADATTKTEEGRTTTKKVWKHEVTSVEELAKDAKFIRALFDYCGERAIYDIVLRKLVKDGVREVGGVRIYEYIDVSISTN